MSPRKGILMICLLTITNITSSHGQSLQDLFIKVDTLIPMRDGVRLYTVVYIPKDSLDRPYPILMERTPYSSAPYEKGHFPFRLGPNSKLMKAGYIFVYQDVRGRYMSEGHNLEMTPHKDLKPTKNDVDESSDTFDSIEFLLKMLGNLSNGKVGIWGISYPGFYATASLPAAHPAIKAVSPQAPVTDEFIGDDVNHNGAFFLMDNFDFINYFGKPRTGPTANYGGGITDTIYRDSYDFFLKMATISKTQSHDLFDHKSYIWDEYTSHDTYDDYWQARNIRPHLKQIGVPTLVVGGWFDAEDCFGALNTYKSIEKQNPGNAIFLVMGPWTHGAWSYNEWKSFGPHKFNVNINQYYQDSIETPFFNHFLRGEPWSQFSEAKVYETGSNRWKSYSSWPPQGTNLVINYLNKEARITRQKSKRRTQYISYISDPANPVPYTKPRQRGRNNLYMVEDQRFLSDRTDLVSWIGGRVEKAYTIVGPIKANIYASTSGTDLDIIVKLIDVAPDSSQNLIRAEVFRGKFRNSYTHPIPFKSSKPELITYELPDINHRFLTGHRMMIQIQSSWFPLVDRNPQKFIKIPEAKDSDYQKAEIRIYCDNKRSSNVEFNILE